MRGPLNFEYSKKDFAQKGRKKNLDSITPVYFGWLILEGSEIVYLYHDKHGKW